MDEVITCLFVVVVVLLERHLLLLTTRDRGCDILIARGSSNLLHRVRHEALAFVAVLSLVAVPAELGPGRILCMRLIAHQGC